MQRRDFIRNIVLASAALSVGPAGRLIAGGQWPDVGREGWSGAAFERVSGDYFNVRAPGGTTRLKLVEVSHRRSATTESASLRFRGDDRSRLAEGSYRFAHPAFGEMDVFVVPGTSAEGMRSYRATFGRLV